MAQTNNRMTQQLDHSEGQNLKIIISQSEGYQLESNQN